MPAPAPGTVEFRVRLPSDAGERLKQRAAASGKDIADYAAQLIEEAVTTPTLDDVLAPIRQRFAQSGMNEDELSDFLEEAKHRRRAQRRKASGE
jgi:hypothetical protein